MLEPLRSSFFFFNDTATTEIYTLSLHDALPISRTERATFTVVTTHVASLRVELRPAGDQTAVVLFHDVNDGLREVPWDGLLPGGHLAPPGRYALAVVGRSQLISRSDSMQVYFTVAHEA